MTHIHILNISAMSSNTDDAAQHNNKVVIYVGSQAAFKAIESALSR